MGGDPCDDPRRAVPLAGGRNFRDLGGYATADGRHVRWGMVYRSGSLAGVTDAGVASLRALGIRGLCDLRTTRERQAEPVGWHAALGLDYRTRDYETSFAELRGLLRADLPDAAAARAAMIAGYRRLPFDQAASFRALFGWLAAGRVPVLFNCSAGKDRAGTAAALILTALGVPRETILADYALTDRFVDLEAVLAKPGAGSLGRQPPEVVRAILGTDPAYMAAALDAVAADAATFATYLADRLGIDGPALHAIRDRLLE